MSIVYNKEVTLDAERTSELDTLDDKHSKEVALDAEKASEEDTLDTVSKVGEETRMPELWDDWTEDDSTDDEKDSTLLKRVHGDRSDGMTGQQRTAYTMAIGHK